MPRSRPAAPTARLSLALVFLSGSAAALAILSEPDGAVLFGLCFAGVVAASLLGAPAREVGTVGLGVAMLGWVAVVGPSSNPRLPGVVAHFGAGVLLAYVLADPVRRRWPWARAPRWSRRWVAPALVVLAAGVVWELGELAADALFDVDLSVGALDVVLDLGADLAGALAGLAIRDRLGSPRPSDPALRDTGR